MRHKITPRIEINEDLNLLIGKVARSNCFSSLRGKLLYINNGKGYFEIQKNPEYSKFDICEGNIEYLPEDLIRSLVFED